MSKSNAPWKEVIFSSRLLLTKPVESDMPYLCAWSTSTEASGEYLSCQPLSKEEVVARLRSGFYWNNRAKTFILRLKEDGTPVGVTHYWKKNDDDLTALITIEIADKRHRNKGFGTEAQRALVAALFTHGLAAVEMHTDVDNTPQQRCLDKMGFTYVESCTYRDLDIERPGKLYRMTRTEHELLSLYGQ